MLGGGGVRGRVISGTGSMRMFGGHNLGEAVNRGCVWNEEGGGADGGGECVP